MTKNPETETPEEHARERARFAVLLLAMLLMQFGQVLMPNRVEGVLGPVLFTIVMLTALAVVAGTRRRMVVGTVLAILGCGLLVADALLQHPTIRAAGSAVAVVFLAYAVVSILAYVYRAHRVDTNLIMGSLCVYILLAVIWGELYGLLETLQPGSLMLDNVGDGRGTRAVLQYFSFVTITTVGYGDIYPASPLARATAATEAILGQLYLVVLVARLVGLHTAQEAARRAS